MPFYIFINSIKVINFWNLCENILGFTRKATPAIRRVYRRYPEFIKTMECRHLMYNRELEEVRRMESAGEIFVIRPSRLIKISRTENRPEKIQKMYDLGCLDGMKALQDTAVFLGLEPAAQG